MTPDAGTPPWWRTGSTWWLFGPTGVASSSRVGVTGSYVLVPDVFVV